MAVIIERGKKPRYVNREDGVAAPENGIAVGGNVKGKIVIGNNVDEPTTVKPVAEITPEFILMVEDLDNEIHLVEKAGKIKEWLAVGGNLARVEAIKKNARSTYDDLMKRLGLVEPEKDEADTGAVATRGQVRAGKGGIVVPGNFKGNIVMGENNKFK